VRDRRLIESARKENVLSDKERNLAKNEEHEGHDDADVEGHRYLRSDDGENSDTPDVEGHKHLTKSLPKSDDGEDSGTPDVEAHRFAAKVTPRNHL
jgi:hypothetical protein